MRASTPSHNHNSKDNNERIEHLFIYLFIDYILKWLLKNGIDRR